MTTKQIKLPMACRCGADAASAWDETRYTVFQRIANGGDFGDYDASKLPTWIIYSMEHDFTGGWYISAIHCDMWMGVTMQNYTSGQSVRIEADDLIDALCGLWKWLDQKAEREDHGS